jgi:hypothetical protein
MVEAPTGDGGFVDLIFDAPGLVVGIENKLESVRRDGTKC